MQYFITAGHDKKSDPGAPAFDGSWEADHTIVLRDKIVKLLKAKLGKKASVNAGQGTVMQDNDSADLWQTICEVNAKSTSGRDFLLDIHFDYNAPGAWGSRTFYAVNTSNENIKRGVELSSITAKAIGTRSLGAVPETRSKPQSLGILCRTRPMALLLEVCFLNDKDLPQYQKNIDKVAEAIADWISKLPE